MFRYYIYMMNIWFLASIFMFAWPKMWWQNLNYNHARNEYKWSHMIKGAVDNKHERIQIINMS